jgi:O-antigen/teichoic acid export membrane protein
MSNPIKQLAGQTAVYGVSSILGRLLNYLLVPIHTWAFQPSQYGVVSEFYAYVAFLVVFLTFGMETTFFRFVNKSEDKEKTFNQAFSLVLVLNVIFLITTFTFSDQIAAWMLYPNYGNYVIWFGLILVVDATSSIFLAKLRYKNEPKRFAIIQLSSIGVNIILNLFFLFVLFDKTNPDSMGIGYIFLANLFASLIKPVLLYKDVLRFRFIWNTVLMKSMLVFATPLVIASFAGIINETIDRILIKRLLIDEGTDYAQAQVGIYSACYKLSILINLFIQAYRYAAEPFFFAHEKHKDKNKIYSNVMTYFIIIVTFIFLVISLNLDIFKWFIPNQSYWEGLKIVPILLLANVCLGIYYNQSIWYKLADKTIYGAYISIIGAVLTLSLNFLLIPSLGYMGAAWTTLIVYASMMIISYFASQRVYPIKYNLRKAGLYIFSALTFFGLGILIDTDGLLLQTVLRGLFILLFVSIVWYMEKPARFFRS